MSYEPAVLKGIAWLDEIKPNWRELIDWGMLDMTNANWCIAGQVFKGQSSRSGYAHVLYALPEKMYASAYGFDVPEGGLTQENYKKLHQTWIGLA